MRIAKYIAHAGIASRRQAEQLVIDGKIKVNGEIVRELGFQLDPDHDQLEYNKQIFKAESKVYILLNKPVNYISSVYDPQGRKTVLDILDGIKQRIYPVGRLDYDTEGLLLLSNDGEFTNLMIHPRYEMEKKYEAWVKGLPDENALNSLRNGVLLQDGITASASVKVIKKLRDKTLLELIIHEGRKRQVKRMCGSVGHPVLSLRRTAFAFLTLDGLKTGEYRYLQKAEIDHLIKLAKSINNN